MPNPYQRIKYQIGDFKKASFVEVFETLVGIAREHQSGRALTVPCPFHEDRHPSFAIYPDTNSGHCFSCGWNGGIFRLVMDVKGVDYDEALSIIRSFQK